MFRSLSRKTKGYILSFFLLVLPLSWNACSSDSHNSPVAASPEPVDIPNDIVNEERAYTETEQACVDAGWEREVFKIGGIERKVMWKMPANGWSEGAVVILHGGGGSADNFCTGGVLLQPQISFSNLALQSGLAVFALDATTDVVRDSQGRPCGKRFDFSVMNRPNVDLPYIEYVLTNLIPNVRPAGSNNNVFLTGLSTGGYMTIRAATHFDGLIKAFAPISAGDPYGTDPICDPALSPREDAVGILVDRETSIEIVNTNSCLSTSYPNESPWETQSPMIKPKFKYFAHKKDAIVDYSCIQKSYANLSSAGYPADSPLVLDAAVEESIFYHLWLNVYNQPIVDFFVSQ